MTAEVYPPDVRPTAAALAAPFDPKDVKFKPQMVKNNRCLAMAYIDARAIQDRLDEVVGSEGWQDAYKLLPDGSVVCRLRVKLGEWWITKTDVGSPSEQPDGGDRLKAAFSDALKRAAVKFGIGRYLYRLSAQWVDYDPVKKQITQPPQLPDWARPAGRAKKAGAPKADPPKAETPAARAEAPPVEVEAGNPLTDVNAVLAILAAKGYGWAQLIETANNQFGATYSPTQTRWVAIPAGQRAALVEGLRKLPDPRPETADTVGALLVEWAKAAGDNAAARMAHLLHELRLGSRYLSDFTAEQLRDAGRLIRRRLSEAKTKANTTAA